MSRLSHERRNAQTPAREPRAWIPKNQRGWYELARVEEDGEVLLARCAEPEAVTRIMAWLCSAPVRKSSNAYRIAFKPLWKRTRETLWSGKAETAGGDPAGRKSQRVRDRQAASEWRR